MNLLKRPNRISQILLKICICKRFSSNISYNEPSIFIEDLPWSGEDSTKVLSLQNLLQNCARNRIPMSGMACHCHVIRLGLQLDTLTSNILINFYSKCGLVGSARKVFDEMPARSLVSWNTMIGTYTRDGDEDEGLNLFVCMQREGSRFSEFTVSSVLCACARKFAVFECRQLHCFSVKMGMDLNMFVGTGLVDVYAKSGFVEDALWVFEIMPERNEVTWSSMIAGYVQNGLYEEALVLYRKTQVIGLENNQFTTSSILAACAGLAALIQGNQMHSVIHKCGFASNVFIASSLIDLYSKCGCIKDAYLVFWSAEEGNLVIWNAMISGFSRHARSTEAMILVEKMQQLGMRPNEVTYVALLSLCGHLGLVEQGRKYFNLMRKEHYLSPNVLHYSCMVDVLGRAGLIEEAKDLIDNEMPFEATAPIWGSLLASCRVYGNAEVAEIAATHLFELEPNNAGNHVLLSNTYAVTKRWDDVLRARKVLKDSKVKKEKGKSWIEVRDKVHTFMVGEIAHPRINEIYSRLEDILGEMEKIDYTGDTVHDLHDVEENRKRELLKHHSEKLAFTFGLMCLPNSAPIRIIKNLRICGDCHSFMKLASKLTEKEIVVRDTNRFHHFNNGFCSCGDFW